MGGLSQINWRVAVPAAILALALLLLAFDPIGLRRATQAASLDLASRALPAQLAEDTILIDIDRRALMEAGPWPWPRTLIARVVQAAHESGATQIIFALPLRGEDPAAPQRAIEAWAATGESTATQFITPRLPDTSAVLANVLRETGAALAIATRPGESPAAAADLTTTRFEIGNNRQLDFLPSIAAPALSRIESAEALTLVADGLETDIFGRVTGAALVLRAGDAALPSIATLPLLAATDLSISIEANGRPGGIAFLEPVGIYALIIGTARVQTLTDGSVLLRRDLEVPVISAGDVLARTLPRLEGRTVIIGSTLASVSGTARAPFDGLGVADGLALAAAQVSAGLSPSRPFVLTWFEFLAALLFGGVALYLIYRERPRAGIGIALFMLGLMLGISALILGARGILFDGLAPALVMVLTALGGLATAPNATQGARGRFNHALDGKLPYGIPLRAARNARKMLEHSESRKTTVLMCAIRDFEEIQELYSDDPVGLAGIVTQFQELVAERVRSSGGTVDRYGGASVMAFWNAPFDEPDHPMKACDCALRLIDKLERLNQMIEAQAFRTGKTFAPVHLGIGINTGRTVVGNVGSQHRPDYSAIGETVGIARQLLHSSGRYGPAIIIGEHTYQAVKNRFALLEVDKIAVPAKTYSIRVFALLGNPVVKASPRFRALEEAHESIFEAYRSQNWSLAEALIRECRKLNGAIPSLYDLYDARIRYYRQNPPQNEWDGAFSIPVV